MITFQNLSFNGIISNNFKNLEAPKSVNQNNVSNTLERSPMGDTVSFSSKLRKPDFDDKVYDLDDLAVPDEDVDVVELVEDPIEDVYIVPDEDITIEPEKTDNYADIMSIDEELSRQCKEREEEEDRRRKDMEEQQFQDDMLMYGVVLPEVMALNQPNESFMDDLNQIDSDLDTDFGIDDGNIF